MPAISPTLLGNTIPQSLPEPQKIDNNSWNQVSASNNFTSAIRSNSLLFAWGTNNVYQAGDGTTINKSVPTQISTSSFSLTSSGFDHSAALTIDNRLFVWGNQPSIQALTSFTSWSLISRAGNQAIGIQNDGKLYTWGYNLYGQLGDGTTIDKSSPTQIGNSSWSSVATGEITSLAIDINGRLFAWGYNAQGMVGDGTLVGKSSPVQIAGSWASVSAGYRTAYAIDTTGKLYGWGLNTSYQIGDTTQTSRVSPVQIAVGTSWTQVSAGNDYATAIDVAGQLYIWGNFASTFTPIPTTIYSWIQICGGGSHTAAIRSDNLLYTWGLNSVGQLGDGSTLNKSSPVQIGNSSYSQVSGNYSHSLALRSDGTVWTWGLNTSGQLGNNTTINRSSPIQLGSSSNFSFVNVGQSNSIAINNLGQLFIWGDNSAGQLGQLGTISRSSPTQLGNLFVLADVSSYFWPIQQNAVTLSTSITPSLSGGPVSIYFNGSTSVYNPGSLGVTQVSDGRQSTTEMWVNFDDLGVNRTLFMLSWRNATTLQDGGATGILVNRNANNGFTVFTAQGSANQTSSPSANNLITNTGVWYHIAVQIYFNGCDIYLNGTRVALNLAIRWPQRFGADNPCDITIGSATAAGATNPGGGSNFLGYISNVRICKDLNVYSGASFTVPTAPLTVTQSASTNISAITSGQVITLISTDGASVLNSVPVSWTQASSGSRFTVALKPDASLWAWGLNSTGQLGEVFSSYPAGHTFNRSSPVSVASGSWLQISAGFDHTLAIRSDNTLWTWGNYLAVSLVSTPISWLAVSGGATHTLGIDNQGKLYAWGTNAQGQLGVLDTAARSSPTQVSGLLSWNSVSAGNSFSLAINNTNQLYGWGFNSSGQAGDGTSLNKSSPILIGTGSWSQAHAGFDHAMAIDSTNKLYGWGNFTSGQLGILQYSSWRIIAAGLAIRADNTLWSWGNYPGDNTTIFRSSPIQIGTNDWVTIANIFDSAVTKAAIKVDGSLFMWGDNTGGQLGQNDTINRSSPVQVAGSWTIVDTKQNFTAALNNNGILYAWGNNSAGQLGDNTTISKSSPVLLASPFNSTSWTTVSVGTSNVAALRSDRIMYTWGLNNFGQLGHNNTINRSNPTLLASPFDTTSWGIVSAGSTHVIALRATGSTIVAFGRNDFGQLGLGASVGVHRSLPTQIGTDSWLQVSAGPNSTYGIFGSPGFTMYAWGLNTNGELGLNNSNNTNAPTVNGGLSWNAVGSGYAIDATGKAFIWGPVNSGLGSFTFTVSSPVQVNAYGPLFYRPTQIGNSSWSQIDTGSSYTIGITSDGLMYAWGLNTSGQYGDQTTLSRSSPVLVNAFSWNAVATGVDHVLAIRNDTTLWTWGNSNAILLPVTQQLWTNIAAGNSHTLAVRNDGKLFTWGVNTSGQLGDGTVISRSSPIAIGGTTSFVSVNSGADTGYAKDTNNILYVWGYNDVGQTGTGSAFNRSMLTQIGVNYIDGSATPNIIQPFGTGYDTTVIPFANTVSNFFNRASYITALYNQELASWGDADYMCEMWVNPTLIQASSVSSPLQFGNVTPTNLNANAWSFGYNAAGRVMLYYNTVASGLQQVIAPGAYIVTVGQWQHLAFTHTFSTGVIRLYLNGVMVLSTTRVGTPVTQPSAPMIIGGVGGIYYNGYISNLRVVRGNIVYTDNFIPPTSALTATQSAGTNINAIIAGQTKLLLFTTPANITITNYTQFDGGKGNHTLAIRDDNTLWAWGQSTTGETGILEPTYSWAQIAGGLALRTDNTLWSWGNYSGDNTTVTRSSPIQIGTNEWASIPLIYDSLYVKAAIKTDKTLWMWGDNSRGQLGQNDTINRSSPVQVAGSWNQISVQFSHTAALDSTNIMYVWGNNAFGQLGTNDTINRSSPVLLASPFNTTSWSFVGVGYSHTTGLRSDAIIYSWGNNTNGQLGDNTTISKSNPVLLGTGFPTVSWNQISVGSLHVLARRNNNILHSWGNNTNGQLADSTVVTKSLPVVIGTSSWIHVTAGRISSFGISIFGALFSWGNNATGELGLNDVTQRNSPVQIGTLLSYTLTGVQAATDGYGRAYIWGGTGGTAGSQSGLLDTAVINSSPVIVGGFRYPVNKYYAPQQLGTSSWLQVASGRSYSLAIDANNRLFGWGLNTSGQLGNYINLNQSSPVQLFSGSSWLAVAAGADHALAIRSDTTLWAWGNYLSIYQNILPTSWGQISAGANHSLAIRSDGKLYAWGQNNVGQLGINTTATMSSPVLVGAPIAFGLGAVTNVSLSSWSVVSAGNSFSTAIDANNNLYVWGGSTETNFQTGDPWAVNRSNPVQISLGITDTSGYGQETYSYDVRITTTNVPPISGSPVAGEFGLNGNFTAPGSLIPSYIHLNTSFPLRFETNNFTVECWINWQGSLPTGFLSNVRYIIAGNTNSSDTTWWELSYAGFNGSLASGFRFATLGSEANYSIGLFQNRWYHIAAVRISGNVVLYLDGVSVATSAGMSGSISSIAPLRVGFVGANGLIPTNTNVWIGYISNLRIVNGVGVYTGNFTVPTSVLTTTQSAGTNIQAITSGQTALLLLTNTSSVQASTFTDVSAGDTHAFAELSNGVVYGWGNNNVGQVEPWGDFPSWNMVSASVGQNGTGISIRNSDKALMVWGLNDVGQLGINNTINRSSPTQLGSNSWLLVSSQGRTTAAIRNDNTLWVWGWGSGGKLGINETTNRSSPVQLAGSWTNVTIGPKIAAAIRTDGTLWIWGDNPDGTTVQRSSPVQVAGSWSQVTTGNEHILAIDNLGILYAWGRGDSGQLGDGTTIRKATPTLLAAPFATTSFTKVAAGLSQSLAIATDGTLYVWGGNSVGELGLNTIVSRSNPIAIGFPNTFYGSWTAIAAGSQTSAGIANNNLYVWGNAANGVYGNNEVITRSFPLQVNVGYSFTNVSIDVSLGTVAAFTRSDGALFVTGLNTNGGLGDGTTITRSNPVSIGASFVQLIRTPMRIGSTSWSSVSAGTSFTVGINSIGELYAWGLNNNNNLGLNTTINRNDAIVKITGSSWTAVSAGASHTLAIRTDGTIWTWGAPLAIGLSNTTVQSWSQIAESASTSNMAAIRSDGSLFVWGNNNIGQVGDGTTINKSSPTQIGNLTNWAQVELGESFAVARNTSGFVYAWGLNTTGQLGDGTTFNRSSPIQVGNRSYSTVTAGASYALGVSGVNLFAWGINSAGQLGDNTTINKSSPVLVSGPVQITTGFLASWVGVSAGTSHTVAIDNIGTIWTWGNNSVFQLGDNTTANKSNPVQVTTSFSFTSISAGANHSLALSNTNKVYTWGQFTSVGIELNSWTQVAFNDLGSHGVALRSDGSVFTWGLNTSGQLGTGDGIFRSSPVIVQSSQSFIAVGAGSASSYAITQQGVLYAWGLNSSGQIGDNFTINRSAPVQVYAVPNTILLTLQSTSFVDNSNYKNVVSALGTTTRPTVETGPAPYLGNSVLFDASSERVSIPYQSTFNIPPFTNWTFECFVYLTSLPTNSYAIASRDWNAGFASPVWGFSIHSTGFVRWNYSSSGIATGVLTETPAGVVSANTWIHLAFVKTANNVANIYVNGVLQATRSDNNGMIRGSGDILIGAYTNFATVTPANDGNFNGYISDIRIVQGIAVYTGAFTVPTRPLTNTQSAGTNISAINYTSFTSVTAGGSHAAGIAGGKVYIWGNNSVGQIGNNRTINKSSPVILASGNNLSFTQIAAEANYTLAVDSAGILYAWGTNTNYNFGDGTSISRSNMMQIGRSGFSQISAGASHAAGITTTGRLQVWGAGTATLQATTQFSWIQVSRGQTVTYAIRNDGQLYAWGLNGAGQIGDGSTLGPRSSPTLVASQWVTSWTQVSSYQSHALAISSDGKAYAWGLGTSGQLGQGDVVSRSNPVFVPAFSSFSVTDLSSYNATPTNTNSPTFGVVNTLYLNAAAITTTQAAGSTVTYPASSNYILSGDFTIEFWVLPTLYGGVDNICLALGGTGNTWEFSIGATSPAPVIFRFVDNTPTTISISTSPATVNVLDNLWRHIAVTRIGSLISLFLDGYCYSTATYSGNIGNNNGTLQIAKATGVNTGANQRISNIRIINGTGIYSLSFFSDASFSQENFIPPRQPLGIVNTTQTVFLAATIPASVSTPAVVSVTVGESHSALVLSDGSLYTFGGNGNGQLGNNTVVNSSSPIKIGNSSWSQVAAGGVVGGFTGAITSDGKLFMWGQNNNSQLGANITGGATRSSPTQIGLGASWAQISCSTSHSAGIDSYGYLYVWGGINAIYMNIQPYSWAQISSSVNNFTAAIRDDGTLWTWGTGTNGTLGNNTATSVSSPNVVGNGSWISVSAGLNHVAAINWEGKLFTFGLGTSGQLGDNTLVTKSSPVQVAGTLSFSQVSAGGDFTIALTTTNLLYAWGINAQGQLGDSTVANKQSPVPIGSSSWSIISAGGSHSIAVRVDGLAYVWGLNNAGQLGLGVTLNRSSPVQLSATDSWTKVSAGVSHTSAIRTDTNGIYVWGLNNAGQLGNNTTLNRSSPIQIGTESWAHISASGSQTQAIRSDGTLWGWGLNTNGQIGDSTVVSKSSPVQIAGGGSWNQITYSAGLKGSPTANLIAVWGLNTNGRQGVGDTTQRQSPVVLGTVGSRDATNAVALVPEKRNYSSYTQVAAGQGFTLHTDPTGRLWGWGVNTLGQIGDNTLLTTTLPVAVGTSSWTQVTRSSAVRSDGTLWGWGSNANWVIGDLSSTNRQSPVLVGTTGGNAFTTFLSGGEYIPLSVGTSSWSQVSVGTSMTMALRADNSLFTWGLNTQGQLGLGDAVTRSSPVQVLGGMKWSSISTGLSNAFGIASGKGLQNRLFAWGNAAGAILGFGDQTNRNSPTFLFASTGTVIPSVVLNNLSFSQISAGVSYSIAKRSVDNAVMGWNQNAVGQLGDNTLIQSGRSYPSMIGFPVDADNSIQRFTPTYSGGIKTIDFSPFISQPYNTSTNGGSVEFNGVDTTVSYAYSTLFDILTSDVSVEVWAYWNTFKTATSYMTLFGQNAGASTTIALNSSWTLNQNDGILQVRLGNDTFRGTWVISTNTWYHLVVTIQSGNARVFANGQLVFYLPNVGNIAVKNEAWSFGSEDTGRFDGFMSNFRLVVGEVPTTYQTVQVLGAIDQSSFNSAMTDVNSAVTFGTGVIPFAGATAAFFIGNATVVGSNSYLTTPNAAGFQFGTGDFTVEFFMRKYTTYQAGMILALNTASIGNWAFIMAGGFFYWQNGFNVNSLGPNLSINTYFPINTWKHVAIVRISGTINIYVDGVSIANYADTTNYNGTGILNIGSTAAQTYGPYEGYLSNLRIVKGVGVYTGNFTTPISPLTSTQSAGVNINAITGSQTSLLLFTTPASSGTAGVQIFTSPTTPLTQTSQGISSARSTRLLCLQGFSTTYNGSIAATGRASTFTNNNTLFITGVGTTGEQGNMAVANRSTPAQLGTQFTGLNLGFNVPVQVTTGSWSQVRAGTSSSMALRNDGTVWTWGLGTSGQLGTRSLLSRSTPVQVTTLSTTFIDNSTNNLTLTTVATDASMVIFSPFATVPYDASTLGGAGYLSNGYLTIASNTVLAMSTGDFTCEAWIYITDFTSTWRSIFSTRASSSTVGSTVVWALGVNNTGFLYFYSGAFQAAGPAGVIAVETWYHVAVSRASNSMRLFVNGVQTGSTSTTSENYTTQTATIGANGDGSERFFGYISNLRLVKGQALYTSNFTPSVTPLTTTSQGAIAANVSLLTCGSFASTIPTTMNSIAIGTSFAFSRQTTDSSLFAWGTNTNTVLGLNITTAAFSSPAALNSGQYINGYTMSPIQVTPGTSNYSQVYAGTGYSFARTTNNDLYVWGLNSSGQLGLQDTPFYLVTRSNPTLVNQSYMTVSDVSTNLYPIFRSGSLTSSISIVPSISGSPVSALFNGSSYLIMNSSSLFSYFATNFTMEAWVNHTTFTGVQTYFTIESTLDATNYVYLRTVSGTGRLDLVVNGTSNSEITGTFNTGTWYHIAVVRSSGSYQVYRNGGATAIGIIGSNINYSTLCNFANIGANDNAQYFFGYMSNVRWSGVAVYTGNFTPPTGILTTTQSSGTNIAALTGTQVGLLTLTTAAATVGSTSYNYSSIGLGAAFTAGVLTTESYIQTTGTGGLGQLGLGDTLSRSNPVVLGSIPILNAYTTSPVQVNVGTSNYTQIFAGQSFSVVKNSSDQYFVWGLNTSGQLGINNAITRSSPTLLGLSSFVQVSAGYTHLMSINATNNYLQATGAGSSGQLGLSDTGQRNSFVVVGSSNINFGTLSPLQVMADSGFSWVSVSAGQSFSLAEKSDGTVYAWGLNNVGQTDNNNTISRSSPTLVGAVQTFVDQSIYNKPYINSGVTIETSIRPFVGAVSAYFNGSAQTTMFFSWDTSLNIGNTFCIEGWIYPQSLNGALFSYYPEGGGQWPSYEVGMNAGNLGLRGASSPGAGSQDVGTGLGTPAQNQWSYFVVSWNAGFFTGYLNGVFTGGGSTGATPYNLANGGLRFGLSQGINSTGYFTGYISNIRIIKGSRGYLAAPTNPTGVLPLVQNATSIQAAITEGQLALFMFTNTNSIANSVTSSFNLISAGLSHSTATYTNNNLYAWGLNNAGQLGDNTTYNKVSPVLVGNYFNTATISPVLALSGSWKSVSAGVSHTMAIRNDDTLWIWGLNNAGQLGQITPLLNYSSPVQISGSWNLISAGVSYSLATDTNSLLYAWGLGTSNQLGINSATSRSSPTLVSSAISFQQIGAGFAYPASYGLDYANNYYVFGGRAFGLLGDSLTAASIGVPTLMLGINYNTKSPTLVNGNWSTVSAGLSATGGIIASSLYMWGLNTSGQLGIGATTSRSSPTLVGATVGISDGSANNYGATITGNPAINIITTPITASPSIYFPGSSTIRYADAINLQFGTGAFTIECFIRLDSIGPIDSIVCKGLISPNAGYTFFVDNGLLQLTIGGSIQVSHPTLLSANIWYYVAVTRDSSNDVRLFVNGVSSGILDNTSYNFNQTTDLRIGVGRSGLNFFNGYISNFRIVKGTALYTANFTPPTSPLTAVAGTQLLLATTLPTNLYSQVFVGYSNTYGIQADNTLYGWGNGGTGEISSYFNTISRSTPVIIGNELININQSSPIPIALGSWTSVSAANSSSAAIRNDYALFTWGLNSSGQLGVGNTILRSSPTQIGTSSWTQVSAYDTHMIGLVYTGSAYTWGLNASGQLGITTVNSAGDTINRSNPTLVGPSFSYIDVSGLSNTIDRTGTSFSTSIVPVATSVSSLFNGSTDFLRSDTSLDIFTSTADPYTIEFFVYPTSSGGHFLGISQPTFTYIWQIGPTTSKRNNDGIGTLFTPFALNTWSHFALTYDGTIVRIFNNGVSVGPYGSGAAPIVALANCNLTFGASIDRITSAVGDYFTGYISNIRITKQALYTGNFTPPTGILTTTSVGTTGANVAASLTGTVSLLTLTTQAASISGSVPAYFSSVTTGSSFTGGVLVTGPLYMWGLNTSGQLGINNAITRSSPVLVGTSSWTTVRGGSVNAQAIRSDGSLFVWGAAGTQLARIWGTPLNTSSPVQIGNQYAGQATSYTQIPFLVYPSSWKSVDAGNSITSAINSQDRLFTWGLNAVGQIDGNNTINRSSPTQIGQNLYLQTSAGMSNMGVVGKAT